jgi:hypothetical protein
MWLNTANLFSITAQSLTPSFNVFAVYRFLFSNLITDLTILTQHNISLKLISSKHRISSWMFQFRPSSMPGLLPHTSFFNVSRKQKNCDRIIGPIFFETINLYRYFIYILTLLEVIYLPHQLMQSFTILLLHPYTYFGTQNAILRGSQC